MIEKKINARIYYLLASLILLLPACDWFKQKTVPSKGLKIVSVNSEDVYNDAHLPGDMRISYDKLENLDSETKNWDKDSPIVVYCTDYSCTASKAFVKELQRLGFTNVRAYEGGILEWYQRSLKDKSYRVEGPAQEELLKQPLKPAEAGDPVVPAITADELLKLMQQYK